MRVSESIKRDFYFYVMNADKFNFCGEEVNLRHLYDLNGLGSLECYAIFDSKGIWKPCKETTLLENVIRAKKSINFQIKQWVEGYEDCLMGIPEYMKSFEGDIPDWVETAFRNQLKRKYNNSEKLTK